MHNTVSPAPNVGDEIYIPSYTSPVWGINNRDGGLARVSSVYKKQYGTEELILIRTEEFPHAVLDWNDLRHGQDTLQQRFGNEQARPHP